MSDRSDSGDRFDAPDSLDVLSKVKALAKAHGIKDDNVNIGADAIFGHEMTQEQRDYIKGMYDVLTCIKEDFDEVMEYDAVDAVMFIAKYRDEYEYIKREQASNWWLHVNK